MARPMELQEQFPDVDIEIALEDGLWDVVRKSDIVYTATSSPDYVIDKNLLEKNGLDGGRPLMLVDIAVPRNIGPDSAEVSRSSSNALKVVQYTVYLICWCHRLDPVL
jgi:glutamyl-tRNA reductase